MKRNPIMIGAIAIGAVWLMLSLIGGALGFTGMLLGLARASGGVGISELSLGGALGLGFAILGLLFQISFIFLIGVLVMRFLFRKDIPAVFEVWHKRAHDRP